MAILRIRQEKQLFFIVFVCFFLVSLYNLRCVQLWHSPKLTVKQLQYELTSCFTDCSHQRMVCQISLTFKYADLNVYNQEIFEYVMSSLTPWIFFVFPDNFFNSPRNDLCHTRLTKGIRLYSHFALCLSMKRYWFCSLFQPIFKTSYKGLCSTGLRIPDQLRYRKAHISQRWYICSALGKDTSYVVFIPCLDPIMNITV